MQDSQKVGRSTVVDKWFNRRQQHHPNQIKRRWQKPRNTQNQKSRDPDNDDPRRWVSRGWEKMTGFGARGGLKDVRCAGAGGMQRRVISHGNGQTGEV